MVPYLLYYSDRRTIIFGARIEAMASFLSSLADQSALELLEYLIIIVLLRKLPLLYVDKQFHTRIIANDESYIISLLKVFWGGCEDLGIYSLKEPEGTGCSAIEITAMFGCHQKGPIVRQGQVSSQPMIRCQSFEGRSH